MNKNEALQFNEKDFIAKLQTSVDGLSQKEAAKRLLEYGLNVPEKKKVRALRVLAHQLQSSLIYLLIIASLISYWIKDYSDGTVILVILLINTLLGFYQEYKSEKIVEKLSQFISRQVRIKRDGEDFLLDESQIVPGDVAIVQEGDIVPADMRLISVENLQVNESQLTGESVPVQKRVPPEPSKDFSGLLFTGSIIEKGEGIGIVYATSKNTELGTIAKLSTETKKQTQYEKSLQSLSSLLMKPVLLGLGLVFILKLILSGGFSHISGLFLFIIATAIAVVPEALPVVATVTLASGALKLAKKHVVVKRLSSLEDLGNVNLLCTDKTGTITENKMAITKIVSTDDELFQKLAYAAITPLKTKKRRISSSYDEAFLNYVPKHIAQEAKQLTIAKALPFDPEDRRNRVVLADRKNQKHYLIVMGAPETLLDLAHSPARTHYLQDIKQEGKSGLRHLAMAYKEILHYAEGFDILEDESGLIFLGYVALEDPLRPTAKAAIAHAEKLGIKIKILTGDSYEVAEYVGRQVGLVVDGDKVYQGSELDAMGEDELTKAVLSCNVFARISPTQKYAIIKTLKDHYVVAYQGDGINDAPALKLADVAIAVNSATDIAKDSADIVLLNKSLEVIINGIKYGRSVFININKYIKHTMVSNFGNCIALAVLYLVSVDLPLLPIQVLLTSLITDVPMIAISSDTVEDEDVVRPEKHNVRELIMMSLILGIPTAFFELLYFLMIRSDPQMLARTSLYVFFTFIALLVFYSIRVRGNFWKAKAPSPLLNFAFLGAFLASFAIIYAPQFQTWFGFTPLPKMGVATILILAALYLFVIDFTKLGYYQLLRNRQQTLEDQSAI